MNVLEDKDVLVLHMASYIYAMRYMKIDSSKTPQYYMNSFVTVYLENQESRVETYLEIARSVLNLEMFDAYVKSIDLMHTTYKLMGFSFH